MIGFGIIGCGKIADRHLASIAACEGAQLSALCDIQEERMLAAERTYRRHAGHKQGAIALYRDYSDMLEDDRLRVIVVSANSALHYRFAHAALNRGKHVVLEKPMALAMRDATELARLADERGLMLSVCHQLRYKPVFAELKSLISSGAMGRLYLGTVSIRLQRDRAYYEAARWRGTWDQDGGMLLNQGIHLLDLLQWYMGDYERVYGSLLRGPLPKQTEDVAAGIVHFKRGGIGVIDATTLAYPDNLDNGITLFGEKGTVSIGGVRLHEIRRWAFADPSVRPPRQPEADEHLLMYGQIVRHIEGREATIVDGDEGRKALELIFALYDAHRSRSVSAGPGDTFATTLMSRMEGWS